tara:strand:+ start:855 stop:1247 length:393 start_codon:yes stop_codon:yes gene_type:complete
MKLENLDEDGFYPIDIEEYTDKEVNTFVNCIMSDNIAFEYILNCVVGIGASIDLGFEKYEIYKEVDSEDEEEGQESQTSSEFEDFLNGSIDLLIYDKAHKDWLKYFRDLLVSKEKYELLHILKLEKTWNI